MWPERALPRLHVVADSISIHYGPALERLLAGVAAYSRKTGPDGDLDENGDANGGDSRRVLDHLRALAPTAPWDALLVNCGLHDLRRDRETGALQVPLDEYARNLDAIAAEARRLARALLWARTTPVADAVHNRPEVPWLRFARDVADYNAAADRVMRAAGARLIDLHTFTLRLGAEAYADHVHFDEGARRAQAAFIAGHLYPLFETHFQG